MMTRSNYEVGDRARVSGFGRSADKRTCEGNEARRGRTSRWRSRRKTSLAPLLCAPLDIRGRPLFSAGPGIQSKIQNFVGTRIRHPLPLSGVLIRLAIGASGEVHAAGTKKWRQITGKFEARLGAAGEPSGPVSGMRKFSGRASVGHHIK